MGKISANDSLINVSLYDGTLIDGMKLMHNTRKRVTVRRVVASALIGGSVFTAAAVASPEPYVTTTADRYSHNPADKRGSGVGERSRSSNHGGYRGRNERPCQYTPEGYCTGGR